MPIFYFNNYQQLDASGDDTSTGPKGTERNRIKKKPVPK